ncbi:MAG: hypothetical protein OIN90_01615, partial [Candidatus Methanoperedens sp.]|nr:hypothetical protein [Candidatus Methanoperedens sp.]
FQFFLQSSLPSPHPNPLTYTTPGSLSLVPYLHPKYFVLAWNIDDCLFTGKEFFFMLTVNSLEIQKRN